MGSRRNVTACVVSMFVAGSILWGGAASAVDVAPKSSEKFETAKATAAAANGLTRPMTKAELAKETREDEEKFARLTAQRAKTGEINANVALYPSKYLAATHSAQIFRNFCGPASVRSALLILGISSATQSPLATQLKTNDAGTAWYGVNVSTSPSTGYPVRDVMNNRIGENRYVARSVANNPSDAAIEAYRDRLTGSIDANSPILAGVNEVLGGDYLPGHPTDRNIQHWVAVRGYSGSGYTTGIVDPASGAASVSWSGGVPAYSNVGSSKMARVMGGYGFIW